MNEESYSNPATLDIAVEKKKTFILNGHQYMQLPELRAELDTLAFLAGLAERKKSAD